MLNIITLTSYKTPIHYSGLVVMSEGPQLCSCRCAHVKDPTARDVKVKQCQGLAKFCRNATVLGINDITSNEYPLDCMCRQVALDLGRGGANASFK